MTIIRAQRRDCIIAEDMPDQAHINYVTPAPRLDNCSKPINYQQIITGIPWFLQTCELQANTNLLDRGAGVIIAPDL